MMTSRSLPVRIETENSRTFFCVLMSFWFSHFPFSHFDHSWYRLELMKNCHVRSKDGIRVFTLSSIENGVYDVWVGR